MICIYIYIYIYIYIVCQSSVTEQKYNFVRILLRTNVCTHVLYAYKHTNVHMFYLNYTHRHDTSTHISTHKALQIHRYWQVYTCTIHICLYTHTSIQTPPHRPLYTYTPIQKSLHRPLHTDTSTRTPLHIHLYTNTLIQTSLHRHIYTKTSSHTPVHIHLSADTSTHTHLYSSPVYIHLHTDTPVHIHLHTDTNVHVSALSARITLLHQ